MTTTNARGRKKIVEPTTVDAIEAELRDLQERLGHVALATEPSAI